MLGEVLSGIIGFTILLSGIFYNRSYHEKKKNFKGGGNGTIIGEIFYTILVNSPYFIVKIILIIMGLIILILVILSHYGFV
ncbi:hypothetical protein HHO41_17865 [Bacillus sp. DNRA2]|uniref:hypothetical protein n=1 Tax=Bacillus sp. DNRA2 TaxID=2723053 RepID=UPI00145F26B3|nr:hypothetical protein [Bacillus sp. DNRA2]NMD72145.1 hypothetical protein [Bacillus sp. DNRA2]